MGPLRSGSLTMTGDPESERSARESVDWKTVPPDPDLSADLGYELAEMDVIETRNGSGQLLFLPWDEEMIRESSFIVAERDTVVDLVDWR